MYFSHNDYLKNLSIKEIARFFLHALEEHMEYSCYIAKTKIALAEKGLNKALIQELLVRRIVKLLLSIDSKYQRISKFHLKHELDKLVKEYSGYKKIDANKKVYRIKVSLDEVDDKIYRIYDITATSRLSTLAYTILGSFNTLAYHLYNFEMDGEIYHCDIEHEEFDGYEINAKSITLNKVLIEKNDKCIMTYDFGCDWKFNIELIDILEKVNDKKYPYIVEGKGKGIIEDEGIGTLLDFIEANDKGEPTLVYISDDEYYDFEFDYREFNLEELNKKLPSEIRKIKNGFEKY